MYGKGLIKGLFVTLKNLVRPPFTVQYPEERLVQHPRFRGQEFAWYEERCTDAHLVLNTVRWELFV